MLFISIHLAEIGSYITDILHKTEILGHNHVYYTDNNNFVQGVFPQAVLSKRKKCKASRPRKSVTFSDNIAMVSAMDHYITDTDTCSGYVSDEEEKYKYQRGAYSDNELDDDDSNTTDSPVEILPGQNWNTCLYL
jgi:hypothetical protein